MRKILLLIATLLPIAIHADDSEKCGDNVTYTYVESTKTMTISGEGDMWDYSTSEHQYVPWKDYKAGIQAVVIENSVTSVGNRAFDGCENLASVTLGESLKTIGVEAFANCSSLTTLNLPSALENIDVESFRSCTSLVSIVVADGNKIFDSRDNCNAIIRTADNTLFRGCKTTVIPSTVTSFGQAAFMGTNDLGTFTVPINVETVDATVFYDCRGLTTLIFEEGVKSIGREAIKRCGDLTTVRLGSTVTSFGNENFNRCEKLKDVYCFGQNPPEVVKGKYGYSFSDKAEDNMILKSATLHVPAASIDAYSQSIWGEFGSIVALTDSDYSTNMSAIKNNCQNGDVFVYDLSGQRLSEPKKGINIIGGKKVVIR